MGIRSRAIFDWNYYVHKVDEKGDILETVAQADHFDVALAAFEAAMRVSSWSRLELRFKARVMRQGRTGAWSRETETCEVLS